MNELNDEDFMFNVVMYDRMEWDEKLREDEHQKKKSEWKREKLDVPEPSEHPTFFTEILAILIIIFLLHSCLVTEAKQRLEYNPIMEWYYYVDEPEPETYAHRNDDEEEYKTPSNNSSSSKQYSSNFNITEDFIRNMPSIETQTFKFIFPDGTTGYGKRSDFERIMKEKYTYGFMKINGRWYYKNQDGTFKSGWQKDNRGVWYYFDPLDLAEVQNTLKEIDGKVYYFNANGEMESDKEIELDGYKIKINVDGSCCLID